MSHLLDTGPKKEDLAFQAWDEENFMVMSWLWNSMFLKISDTIMFLSMAQDIWDVVKQTYSEVCDTVQRLKPKSHKCI